MNDDDIRMAKELGMAAGSLIKNIPARGQMWKLPVKEWIRELYAERFGNASRARDTTHSGDHEISAVDIDEPDDSAPWLEGGEKRYSREELRLAGTYVARELSLLPEVVRVVLFGLVVKSTVFSSDETKRCKDVDLAVWLTDLSRLKALQNAKGEALNRLRAMRNIVVDSSRVDVHILEPGSERYRGRLCNFGACPERYNDACMLDGCGAQPFLRQLSDYRHDRDRFALADLEILFERPGGEAMLTPYRAGITDDDVPF